MTLVWGATRIRSLGRLLVSFKKEPPLTTSLSQLQEQLGFQFKNLAVLEQALTHKSFHYENLESSSGDNERLEFLGDAVLDLAVGAFLMELFPENDEGDLSKKRAYLVSENGLAEIAEQIGLNQNIRLGKGEDSAGGSDKPRILSGAFEAVIGAIFTESGYEKCDQLVRRLFLKRAEGLTFDDTCDSKSRFQELVQEREKTTPLYKVLQEHGPDHQKEFEIGVYVKEELIAEAKGKSKKIAEQEAARIALQAWKDKK